MIKVATFNLENLFTRPAAMNGKTGAEGRRAIEHHATANAIVARASYSETDKATLVALSKKYGWHLASPRPSALVKLNKVRGRLFGTTSTAGLRVVADGRDDWTGWFELRRDDLDWKATYNAARVLSEVDADVVCVVEAENRATLLRFNEQVLGAQFGKAYPHVMLIDGNDDRGIDVGLLSRFKIERITSHVDDRREDGVDGKVFSRDCPEYDLLLPGGARLVVLPNHFKSKRNGDDDESSRKRRAQARRAHDIAQAALARSPYVLVAGDLNDTPDSPALTALFTDGFDDIIDHPDYPKDRPGTYGTGLASGKLDYLISSPDLWTRIASCGIERRGSYHPRVWKPFDTVTKASEQASDHHCAWMTVELP